ncbi:MAG: glutamine-hydrolyzing GMP synthase, partial [Bacteroidales bacterium]|nr:glutamine-hydrolyzing GMP synthase [Bacteroidales bacterium]
MNKILILDFGSQVTQLIGRRLRELNVYCEIYPYDKMPALDDAVKGVILSGSPCSVRDANAPQFDLESVKGRLPVLGICYGAQYIAHHCGGKVEGSLAREYGRAMLEVIRPDSPLMDGVKVHSQVWMSHGDTISRLPEGGVAIAQTADIPYAAYQIVGEPTFAVQFHPEVFHTEEGSKILAN